MNIEHLVGMVNDIAAFFHSEPDHTIAVDSIALHLRRFWDPRMRRQIIAHVEAGGHGLVELGREGVEALARMQKKEVA
jgi:formate dehydrogenase subunit delta